MFEEREVWREKRMGGGFMMDWRNSVGRREMAERKD